MQTTDSSYALRGPALDLVCNPQYGFHITSLVERRSECELLWLAPTLPPPQDELGDPGFGSIESWEERVFVGGWFAMFPSCGLPSARVDRRTWMHGEVARRRWEVRDCRHAPDVLSAEVALRSESCVVRRTVTMTTDGFRLATEAENTGPAPLYFTYGEHPCFARSPFAGGRISADVSQVAVPEPAAAPDRALYTRPSISPVRWPDVPGYAGLVAADVIPEEADGRLDHLCLRVKDAAALITAPQLDGALRISCSERSSIHDVLLWQRFDHEGGFDVFALEPSTSPGRSYDDATVSGSVRVIGPGETVSFGVDVAWVPGGLAGPSGGGTVSVSAN